MGISHLAHEPGLFQTWQMIRHEVKMTSNKKRKCSTFMQCLYYAFLCCQFKLTNTRITSVLLSVHLSHCNVCQLKSTFLRTLLWQHSKKCCQGDSGSCCLHMQVHIQGSLLSYLYGVSLNRWHTCSFEHSYVILLIHWKTNG